MAGCDHDTKVGLQFFHGKAHHGCADKILCKPDPDTLGSQHLGGSFSKHPAEKTSIVSDNNLRVAVLP